MSIDLVYQVQIVVQNGAKRVGNADVIKEAIDGIGSAYSVVGDIECLGTWEFYCEGGSSNPEIREAEREEATAQRMLSLKRRSS
jgi:hypothetical protein